MTKKKDYESYKSRLVTCFVMAVAVFATVAGLQQGRLDDKESVIDSQKTASHEQAQTVKKLLDENTKLKRTCYE